MGGRSVTVASYPLACLSPAWAQNIAGTITGTIQDVSGGAIVGATVVVTNEATGIEFRAETNEVGIYVAPNLAPGSYAVAAEFAGFRRNVARGVRLLANRTVRVDLALEPGTVTEAIGVQASAPVVNSESATIGNLIEFSVITALPLNGRSLDRLVRISAGVNTDSPSDPHVAGSACWGGIQFTVYGASFNDVGNGGGVYSYRHGLVTMPSVDSVSEFKIDSNNQKAEFEGAVSALVVTKSGTSEFHGSLLWFNRNKAYAARNFFAAHLPKPPFNRNEFGYAVDGPILRNRTFLHHSYEGLRERTSPTYTLSVATAAMREADFAGLPTIVHPLNQQPFPNNRVPAARIDSRSKALLDWVPLPNAAGTGPAGTLNNYIFNSSNVGDVNRYFVRLDHRFTDQDAIWVSFSSSKGFPYWIATASPARYGSWQQCFLVESASATYMKNFSPTTLNEFRLAFLRSIVGVEGMNRDFDPRSLIPDLYPPTYGGLPNVNISSHVSIGDYGGGPRVTQLTPQYINNLTMVRGKHTIKMGFDFANNRVARHPFVAGRGSGLANNAALGRFDFNGRFTNDDLARAAQPAHAFANFLLGYPNFVYRSTSSPPLVWYSTRSSVYVQDDFQVSPLLTLNYGERYMVQTPWRERDQAASNFDFASSRLFIAGERFPAQAQPRLIQAYPIVLARDAGLPQNLLETDKNNWGPRLGFALRPFQPWSNVLVLAGGGDSNLHQLQLEAIQRYRGGLTFQLEYSWNRSLDNVPIVGGPQNPWNARADRGNSDQVRRHIFTAAYTYDLPFGPGKRFLNVGGLAGHIVGGWQIAGITYLRTGPPFSVSFNAALAGWLGGRADVLRDPKLPRSERSIYRWFDASAFAVPAPYTWGNSARNLLFAPGDIVFDVSVLKDFRLTERLKAQFRGEFFNLPNHAYFGVPAANISVPATVGRITSAGAPRQIQFGLKLLF